MADEITLVLPDGGTSEVVDDSTPDDGTESEDEWVAAVRAEIVAAVEPIRLSLLELVSLTRDSAMERTISERNYLETLQALTGQISEMGAAALAAAAVSRPPETQVPTPLSGDSPTDDPESVAPVEVVAVEEEAPAPPPAPRRRPVL